MPSLNLHEQYKDLRFEPLPENNCLASSQTAKVQAWPSYAEEADIPPRFNFSQEEQSITRTYRCKYDRLFDFKDYMLGYSYTAQDPAFPSGTSSAILHRIVPFREPTCRWLYATDFSVVETAGKAVRVRYGSQAERAAANADPMDKWNDQASVYGYDGTSFASNTGATQTVKNSGTATVEVVFKQKKYVVLDDDEATAIQAQYQGNGIYGPGLDDTGLCNATREMWRWCSVETTYAIQSLPLAKVNAAAGGLTPAKKLRFVEGPAGIINAEIPEPGVILLPIPSVLITFHEVPWTSSTRTQHLLAYIREGIGKVNVSGFGGTSRIPYFKPETALMQAPTINAPRRNSRGGLIVDIVYRLDHKEDGWNRTLAPNGKYYAYGFKDPNVAFDPVNDSVYKSAVFTNFFRFTESPVVD